MGQNDKDGLGADHHRNVSVTLRLPDSVLVGLQRLIVALGRMDCHHCIVR